MDAEHVSPPDVRAAADHVVATHDDGGIAEVIDLLLEPFRYSYMFKAIWVSALVAGVCAFLSCYLVMKRWAPMGDALSHAVVPGVAPSDSATARRVAGARRSCSAAFTRRAWDSWWPRDRNRA